MNAFERTLGTVRPEEANFVAGVLTARGKFYLGSTPRGASVRYTPSLSVELSARSDVPLLDVLFGPPQERGYYGKTTWRWVSQDKARIMAVVEAFVDLLPVRIATSARALAEFCDAVTPSEQRVAFEKFKTLSQLHIV